MSRSAVSRQAIEASVEQVEQLQERRWSEAEMLVIYIDGQRFGEHPIISAVGVDSKGHKHILGIASGATENAAAVKQVLTGLRDRGMPTDRKYLFVIDGSKALRAAIEEVFGREQEVQRRRNHKIENVMNELPKQHQQQTRKLMRAAFKLSSTEEGEKRLEADRAPVGARPQPGGAQLARRHERDVHLAAAEDPREPAQVLGDGQLDRTGPSGVVGAGCDPGPRNSRSKKGNS